VVLNIAHSQLKLKSDQKKSLTHSFALLKNERAYELRFSTNKICEEWIAGLKFVCVLDNFHENYKTVKTIGKGGFSQVNNTQRKWLNLFRFF